MQEHHRQCKSNAGARVYQAGRPDHLEDVHGLRRERSATYEARLTRGAYPRRLTGPCRGLTRLLGAERMLGAVPRALVQDHC